MVNFLLDFWILRDRPLMPIFRPKKAHFQMSISLYSEGRSDRDYHHWKAWTFYFSAMTHLYLRWTNIWLKNRKHSFVLGSFSYNKVMCVSAIVSKNFPIQTVKTFLLRLSKFYQFSKNTVLVRFFSFILTFYRHKKTLPMDLPFLLS